MGKKKKGFFAGVVSGETYLLASVDRGVCRIGGATWLSKSYIRICMSVDARKRNVVVYGRARWISVIGVFGEGKVGGYRRYIYFSNAVVVIGSFILRKLDFFFRFFLVLG